jgi:hypothetical protein
MPLRLTFRVSECAGYGVLVRCGGRQLAPWPTEDGSLSVAEVAFGRGRIGDRLVGPLLRSRRYAVSTISPERAPRPMKGFS